MAKFRPGRTLTMTNVVPQMNGDAGQGEFGAEVLHHSAVTSSRHRELSCRSSAAARRMRFRPRSRPSDGTTPSVVCAPPPCPPAPMETAGIPRDSGMLASVEAQSSRERIPRWASTERMSRDDRGIAGEARGGPAPDLADSGGDLRAGGARVFDFLGACDGVLQRRHQLIDLFVALRPDIDFGASAGGNRVDARAAFDDARH